MMFSIDADYLEFGSYDKDNFAVLFVDMRNSTTRAQRLGAEKRCRKDFSVYARSFYI